MSRPRRVRRRYVRRRPHPWLDPLMSHYYAAEHAWELDAEAESLGYATEHAEYAAEHPRPTLKGLMVALARPDRHEPDQHDTEHNIEEGQTDDTAA